MSDKKYGLLVILIIFISCLLYEFLLVPWDYEHVSPEIMYKYQQINKLFPRK